MFYEKSNIDAINTMWQTVKNNNNHNNTTGNVELPSPVINEANTSTAPIDLNLPYSSTDRYYSFVYLLV